jgi:hypothetical protein
MRIVLLIWLESVNSNVHQGNTKVLRELTARTKSPTRKIKVTITGNSAQCRTTLTPSTPLQTPRLPPLQIGSFVYVTFMPSKHNKTKRQLPKES